MCQRSREEQASRIIFVAVSRLCPTMSRFDEFADMQRLRSVFLQESTAFGSIWNGFRKPQVKETADIDP